MAEQGSTPPGAPGEERIALHIDDGVIRVWEWHAPTSVRPVDWRRINEVPAGERTEVDVDGRVVVADGEVWVFVDELDRVRTW